MGRGVGAYKDCNRVSPVIAGNRPVTEFLVKSLRHTTWMPTHVQTETAPSAHTGRRTPGAQAWDTSGMQRAFGPREGGSGPTST